MNNFQTLLEQLQQIPSLGERQAATAQALDEANTRGEETLMAEICRHVIGISQDNPNHDYAADFQISCLHWLSEDCIERLNAEKTEAAKEAVWQELFYCLWAYKWIVPDLPLLPDMEKAQIQFYNELMRDYYERGDFSLAPYYKVLMLQAMYMGDVDEAKKHYQAWHSAESDEISDCPACELNDEVVYHHFIGQYKKAAQLAEPILSGEASCGEVPHNTYYAAIDSLIESDNWQAAEQHLQAATKRLTAESQAFLHLLPRLIQLHIRLGKYSAAEDLMAEFHAAIANRSQVNPMLSLEYLMAAAYFDESARELAQELAAKYDERNANRYYSKRLQQLTHREHRSLQ